jgi:hypothetical protein
MGIIIPANDYEASELAFSTLLNVLPVNAKIEEVVSENEIIVDKTYDTSYALGLEFITQDDVDKYYSAKIGLVVDDELVELYNLAKSQGKIELAMSILMEIKNNNK